MNASPAGALATASGPATTIEHALHQAEELCAARQARLTPLRKFVLELILCRDGVIKAYDILDALKSSPYSAKPPTVYRALEFLQEQHLVHRIESMNGFVACRHPDTEHNAQFFICTQCNKATEVHWPEVQQVIDRHVQAHGFTLQKRVLELKGTCATPCQG